jgi:signal transduction histidine kinase
MFNLSQRLIAGCILLAALSIGMSVWAARMFAKANPAFLPHATAVAIFVTIASILVAGLTIAAVLHPLKKIAREAHRIGQGDWLQRVDWNGQDSLGRIVAEFNRLALHLRDLRESEAGRRQMEYQLSDAVLQSIFEPIIVTDAKGHVLKLNQAANEVFGASSEDRDALTNTPGGDKILFAIRDAVQMQRAVAGEGEAAMLPMKIGSLQKSYRLRTTPMRDSEGRLLGAVTTLEDVTELQDIDRFKSRFIAIASSKLRTPLQRLRLSIYTLAQGFGGELLPLQRDLVTGANEEAENLTELMADLVDVAELDSGSRQLRIESIRPFTALENARSRASEEARKRGITIEVHAFHDLSPIRADRRALRSVLDNLMQNALRYTPTGGEIHLSADENKETVQFSVRDTGAGIAADRLPSLFGRFSVNSDSGTGLGLSLVHRLVESMEGQISVESRLGAGTTFRFVLPVAITTESRHPIEVG